MPDIKEEQPGQAAPAQPPPRPARFDIVVGTNNMIQWKLIGPDGREVLASKGYGNKDEALAGVRAVKENAAFNERYDRQERDKKHLFRIKSASHEVLATSGLYEKPEEREAALAVVRGSHEAAVHDRTIV